MSVSRRRSTGIDTWASAEQAQAFSGSPQIQDFFQLTGVRAKVAREQALAMAQPA